MVTIKALRNYTDKELSREIVKDEEYQVTEERANVIIRKGFADLVATDNTNADDANNQKGDNADGLQGEVVETKKKTNTRKR